MTDPVSRLNTALEGRYRIERKVGEGGMAVVYLARDVRHNRDVALKVLKNQLVAVVGSGRFLAEIETTAKLQHPRILPLFDSGEADGFLYYVMPYVRGETLRDRIDRQGPLPVEDAVRIASAVANALQAAHDHGVVHRDIKPGNILLQNGEPVVSDFGVALSIGQDQQGRLTETGLSLGTPSYMSPEQATGDQTIGPAADIYALGCVLYEMLAGQPPYRGASTQAVLAKILQGGPVAVTEERKSIPPHVDAVIRKSLERLPADRFTEARDLQAALADPTFRYGPTGAHGAAGQAGAWRGVAAASSALAVAFAGLATWALLRQPDEPRVERFESPFRAGQEPVDFSTEAFDLSDAGDFVVYRGPSAEATARLWVREWTALEARPVRGTGGAVSPAVSPDGSEIAFALGSEVRVIAVEGGAVRTLGPGSRPAWGPDGWVYFSSAEGLVRARADATGSREVVAELAQGHRAYWPSDFDEDRGGVWVTVVAAGDPQMQVGLAPSVSGDVEVLAPGSSPTVSPTGHLAFLSEGRLVAAPLDGGPAALSAPPSPVVEGVSAYALSRDGRLFYAAAPESGTSEFVWITRSGQASPVDPGWSLDIGGGGNIGWSLSPSGDRLALRRETAAGVDIWVKELDDGPLSRLTVDPSPELSPRWSPDGERVIFVTDRETSMEVWSRRADGAEEARLLFEYAGRVAKALFSPDGAWLVLRRAGLAGGSEGQRDILAARVDEDGTARPLVASPEHAEQAPALSPDGRWLAYSSNETGRNEIFVRPFPNVEDGKWQVSTDGGIVPLWAHNGRELFFVDPGPRMVAAQVVTTPTFAVRGLEPLFDIPPGYPVPQNGDPYDVTPDDERFIMARVFEGGPDAAQRVILVTNFDVELARLLER